MTTSRHRQTGLACIAGASISIFGGIAAQIARGSSSVSDELWSYPWGSDTFVWIALLWSLSHLLILPALLRLREEGGRGATAALVGTAGLAVAELASIPIRDQQLSETGPALVGAGFGLATLLTAVGFLMAGVAIRRQHRWDGWRRFTPLAVGAWALVLTGLAVTPVVSLGVTVFGLTLAAFGAALMTMPARIEAA